MVMVIFSISYDIILHAIGPIWPYVMQIMLYNQAEALRELCSGLHPVAPMSFID